MESLLEGHGASKEDFKRSRKQALALVQSMRFGSAKDPAAQTTYRAVRAAAEATTDNVVWAAKHVPESVAYARAPYKADGSFDKAGHQAALAHQAQLLREIFPNPFLAV